MTWAGISPERVKQRFIVFAAERERVTFEQRPYRYRLSHEDSDVAATVQFADGVAFGTLVDTRHGDESGSMRLGDDDDLEMFVGLWLDLTPFFFGARRQIAEAPGLVVELRLANPMRGLPAPQEGDP